MINSVTSFSVYAQFRFVHRNFAIRIESLYDVISIDGIVYFKRKKGVSIVQIRDLIFLLLSFWSRLLNDHCYKASWNVREIIDTLLYTLK